MGDVVFSPLVGHTHNDQLSVPLKQYSPDFTREIAPGRSVRILGESLYRSIGRRLVLGVVRNRFDAAVKRPEDLVEWP